MDDPITFGQWLKRCRKALDLTQNEFARRVGCSIATIQKIETDERRPSKITAARLAQHLNLPRAEQVAFVKAARAELSGQRLSAATPPVERGDPAATPLRMPAAYQPPVPPVAAPCPGYRSHPMRERTKPVARTGCSERPRLG